MAELDVTDKALARLYMAACFHQWAALPGAQPTRLARHPPRAPAARLTPAAQTWRAPATALAAA
jgi:hypothetical protein